MYLIILINCIAILTNTQINIQKSHHFKIYGTSFKRNIFTNDKTMVAKRAVPNPEILKPGTILVINIKSKALITKVNKPKVKKFMGSVNKINIGLIIKVIIPHTIEITSNACHPLITKPGTK